MTLGLSSTLKSILFDIKDKILIIDLVLNDPSWNNDELYNELNENDYLMNEVSKVLRPFIAMKVSSDLESSLCPFNLKDEVSCGSNNPAIFNFISCRPLSLLLCEGFLKQY